VAIDKIQSESINLADNFAFTGTVTGAGGAFSPRFSVYLGSGNQTISNSTETVAAFNTEVFDDGGCYNNTSGTVTLNGISTPAYSFAPNVAGTYIFGLKAAFQTDANHYSIMYLYKNSTTLVENQYYNELGNNRPHNATMITSMNGTSDSVNMRVWQNSGSSKSLYGTELYNSHFFGYLLKAT